MFYIINIRILEYMLVVYIFIRIYDNDIRVEYTIITIFVIRTIIRIVIISIQNN